MAPKLSMRWVPPPGACAVKLPGILAGSEAGSIAVSSALTAPLAAVPAAVTRPAAGSVTCAMLPATVTVVAVAASKLRVAPTRVRRALARAPPPAGTVTVNTLLAWPASSKLTTLASPAGTSVRV